MLVFLKLVLLVIVPILSLFILAFGPLGIRWSIITLIDKIDTYKKVIGVKKVNEFEKSKKNIMEKKKNDFFEIIKEKWYLFVGIIFLWIVSLGITLFLKFYFSKGMADLGAVGDSFGAINALFSGLAFAGMIVTLVMQKQELELQREELKETREEMKCQTEQFESQTTSFQIQLFENTFFSMLNQHERIVDNLKFIIRRYPEPSIEYSGKEAIFHEVKLILNKSENKSIKECFKERFEKLYTYLNHTIKIMLYIDKNQFITIFEKRSYLQSFLSTFSIEEFKLLSVYGLIEFQIRNLIEKYGLFESINFDTFNPEIKDQYDISKATKFNDYPIHFELKKFEIYSYQEGHYTYKIDCKIETMQICYFDYIKLKNKKSFIHPDVKEKNLDLAFRDLHINIKGVKYHELYDKFEKLKKDAEIINDFKLSRNVCFTFLGGFVNPYYGDHSHDQKPHDNWFIEISVDNIMYEIPLSISDMEVVDLADNHVCYNMLYF